VEIKERAETARRNKEVATTEPRIAFRVAEDSEPGDVVPALAKLLITLARRRKADEVHLETATSQRQEEEHIESFKTGQFALPKMRCDDGAAGKTIEEARCGC
jgi:hypothetical protein